MIELVSNGNPKEVPSQTNVNLNITRVTIRIWVGIGRLWCGSTIRLNISDIYVVTVVTPAIIIRRGGLPILKYQSALPKNIRHRRKLIRHKHELSDAARS